MIYLDKGDAVLKFQHVRRAEWPPAGGSSTVCESLPLTFHGEWIERSVDLLRRIEWQGAAMVEYRYDASTDRLALMEINGRFWGSLPLAYHAGAHFAWTTYSIEGLGKRPAVAPYRSGVVCRYMIPETRRVLTLLLRPDAIDDPAFDRRPWRAMAQYVLAFLRPGTRYFVFSFRDPMPFLFDIAYVLRKMLRLPVK
jgi:predicted ATP-grasp superfamily ATP-dependent carboligase